jgi:hypothetical protein
MARAGKAQPVICQDQKAIMVLQFIALFFW